MRLLYVENLQSGMVLAEDVFISEDSASPYVRAGTEISGRLINGLRRRGVFQVHVVGSPEPEDLPELPAGAQQAQAPPNMGGPPPMADAPACAETAGSKPADKTMRGQAKADVPGTTRGQDDAPAPPAGKGHPSFYAPFSPTPFPAAFLLLLRRRKIHPAAQAAGGRFPPLPAGCRPKAPPRQAPAASLFRLPAPCAALFRTRWNGRPRARPQRLFPRKFLFPPRQKEQTAAAPSARATPAGGSGPLIRQARPTQNILRSPSLVHTGPTVAPGLRDDALAQLEGLFSAITADRQTGGGRNYHPAVTKLDSVVGRLVGSLIAEPDTLVNISNLRSFDDYTYHHSVAVAVLAMGIGQYMGLSAPQLRRLGLCAIMHDIGKTAIPLELLHKPARLSDAEYALIKTHSAEGYRRLLYNTIGDEELWRGVLHHHERIDGTGYPRGLRGNNIPLWSRIITAADVYDALTSQRSYRTPMAPSEAIEYLMGGVGTAFDYDVVESLVRKVDLYPLGSRVELSDGRTAEVIDGEHPLRPVVRILGTDEILDLYGDRHLLNVVIRRLLVEGPRPAASA